MELHVYEHNARCCFSSSLWRGGVALVFDHGLYVEIVCVVCLKILYSVL